MVKEEIKSNLGNVLGPSLASIGTSMMETATSLGRVFYGDELKAIAARSGLKLGRLVILQLVYEASSCCTSIVVPGPDGIPRHIRTMDWGMDLLADLTIEIEFIKGGRTLFITTTWAGYVGVLTGIKPSSFSVSVNFRIIGDSMWTNIKKAATSCWPIGFLLREVFETAPDFDTAVKWLSNSKLIAPCYFTVCGTQVGEGCLLTRNRDDVEQKWELASKGPIVQTNIDHWNDNDDDDILYSIERRSRARAFVDSDPTFEHVTEAALWKLMSRRPILNSLTIYGTYMIPATGFLQTRLPMTDRGGFVPFVPVKDDDNASPFIKFIPYADVNDAPDQSETAADTAEHPLLVSPPKRPKCKHCGTEFNPEKNKGGGCVHKGSWHKTYSDCNYVKCGWGLGPSGIGMRHWSCCFSIDPKSQCKKSKPHEAEDELAE